MNTAGGQQTEFDGWNEAQEGSSLSRPYDNIYTLHYG